MKDVALIILYDKDKKVLMQHRSIDAPTSPNHWGFFGGSVEKGETPHEAIVREVFEELEIKLENPKLIYKEYVEIKDKEHTNFYFAHEIRDKSKMVLHEGQDMKWFFPNEIEDLLAKSYVKRIIKRNS